MRLYKIAALLLLLAAAGFYLTFYHAELAPGWQAVKRANRSFFYGKQVSFEDLESRLASQLKPLLPWDRSVLWWSLREDEIASRLMEHPLVEGAQVERCEAFSWGCFVIKVSARRPAAIAAIGGETWIVGQDGAFMAPLSSAITLKKLFGEDVPKLGRLPVIDGVMLEQGSLEVGRARLRYVLKALALIEEESGYQISRLAIKENGETVVSFRGYNMEAVFDVIKGQMRRLRQEARRFKQVMTEFAGREGALERVDLAFDKVAVIKLADEVVAPHEEKEAKRR
ncbi:MAG: hypothetical protein GX589_03760 [Deltaproteobacteria bacterium]|nr:hypothetical protein [Deltaproteobacteria bacterium]